MFAVTVCILTKLASWLRSACPFRVHAYSFDDDSPRATPPPSHRAGPDTKLDLCLDGVIFRPVYANVPIHEGHVQGSWQKERGQPASSVGTASCCTSTPVM